MIIKLNQHAQLCIQAKYINNLIKLETHWSRNLIDSYMSTPKQ